MAVQVYVDGTDADNPMLIGRIAQAYSAALTSGGKLQIVFSPRGNRFEDVSASMKLIGNGQCEVSYDDEQNNRISTAMALKDFFSGFIRPNLLRTEIDKQREVLADSEAAASVGLTIIIKTLQALGVAAADVDVVVSDVFSDPISPAIHVMDTLYLDEQQAVRTPENYHIEKQKLAARLPAERRKIIEDLLAEHAKFIERSGYSITRGDGWQDKLAASLNGDIQSDVVIAGPFSAVQQVLARVEPASIAKINAIAMAFSLDRSKNIAGDNFNCVADAKAVEAVMALLSITFCPTDLFKADGHTWAQIQFDDVDRTIAALALPQILADTLKLYIRASDPTKKLSDPVFDLALAPLLRQTRADGPLVRTDPVTITARDSAQVYGGTTFDVQPKAASEEAPESGQPVHHVVTAFDDVNFTEENQWVNMLTSASTPEYSEGAAETRSSSMLGFFQSQPKKRVAAAEAAEAAEARP
jgi:hypothetical protein